MIILNMPTSFAFLGLISSVYCFSTAIDDKLVKLVMSPGLKYSEEILLNDSNVDLVSPAKTTVFIIHGWSEGPDKSYYSALFDAYNQKGGYNVIRVDWSAYSKKDYFLSTALIKNVGNRVARYIKTLHADGTGISLSNIRIVGHSLGAHVGGFVGKYVYGYLNAKVARITGLDPAGPRFGGIFNVTAIEGLANDDADMVDVLYTDRGGLGTDREIGSLNFYANDAKFQPGCSIFSFDIQYVLLCSHQRSVFLFIESFNTQFVAYQFQSMSNSGPVGVDEDVNVIFGENTNGTTGRYTFKTNCKVPYAVIEPNCTV